MRRSLLILLAFLLFSVLVYLYKTAPSEIDDKNKDQSVKKDKDDKEDKDHKEHIQDKGFKEGKEVKKLKKLEK